MTTSTTLTTAASHHHNLILSFPPSSSKIPSFDSENTPSNLYSAASHLHSSPRSHDPLPSSSPIVQSSTPSFYLQETRHRHSHSFAASQFSNRYPMDIEMTDRPVLPPPPPPPISGPGVSPSQSNSGPTTCHPVSLPQIRPGPPRKLHQPSLFNEATTLLPISYGNRDSREDHRCTQMDMSISRIGNHAGDFSHSRSQSYGGNHGDIVSPLSVGSSLASGDSPHSGHAHNVATSDEVAALIALRDLKEASSCASSAASSAPAPALTITTTSTPESLTASVTETTGLEKPKKTVYYPEPPSSLKLSTAYVPSSPQQPYRRQFAAETERYISQCARATTGTNDIISVRFAEAHRREQSNTLALPTKRKHSEIDLSPEESSPTVAHLPKIPKPTPRKKKPADGIPRCTHCDRTGSTDDNPLIPCSSCPELWHRFCHVPEIGAETAGAPSGWRCELCLQEEDIARYQKAREEMLGSAGRKSNVEIVRGRYLESLPLGVGVKNRELLGFGGGEASEDQRFDYFSSLDRNDQLELLKLADKLEPNLLAEMLTNISVRYPEMLLFGSPDWPNLLPSGRGNPGLDSPADSSGLRSSKTPLSSKRTKSHVITQKHLQNTIALPPSADPRPYIPRPNLYLLTSVSSPKSPNIAKPYSIPAPPELEPSKSATPEDEVDMLPTSWPRAGQGMYARLLSETDDMMRMVEKGDKVAFHHFTVDQRGRILPKMAVAALV